MTGWMKPCGTRVNPGMAYGFPVLDRLRSMAREALDNPSEMYAFRRFNLNEWLGNSTAPLFNFDTFDARKFRDDESDLEELPCYLEVDFAQSGDLAAVVAAWRQDDGQITIKPWFFVPSEGLEKRAQLEELPMLSGSGRALPPPLRGR